MSRRPRSSSRLGIALLGVTVLVAALAADAQTRIPSQWTDASGGARDIDTLLDHARRAAASDVLWVGYTFALREGVHVGCDDWRGRSVSFGSDGVRFYLDDDNEPRVLPCDEIWGLFLRVGADGDEIHAARLMSWRRAERLEAPVVWAGEYAAAASVNWLRPLVLQGAGASARLAGDEVEEMRRRLLSALAVHDDPGAVDVLFEALNSSYPSKLRESAVFWSGQLGGTEGLEQLMSIARSDPDNDVREDAIFWLAHASGERATAQLAEIAADDPDTDIRRAAVFALSQSDDDAAIDALIEIVRTHDNREVVKSALFWLGQSGDARAIALIEEILFGRTR